MVSRPVPTPEEWAQEQLKNAPVRSDAWARRVARIYGLEVDDVTPADREAVRRARAEDACRSRTAAGLPERIENPAAVPELAALMRETEPPALPRRKADPARPRPGRV